MPAQADPPSSVGLAFLLGVFKMTTLFGENVHAGLAGLELDEGCFELGCGIRLIKTYAHLMAPFLMAFKPAALGKHHPGPWKAASGGFGFDINAELLIPSSVEEEFGSKIGVARTILFLLRLGVNPATTLPVFSSYPFESLADRQDNEVRLLPFEVQPRHFPLGVVGEKATGEAVKWVADHWQVAHKLAGENSEFALAVEAIDSGQFVQNSALTLVSLWGAMEALFSPSTSELRFRVSALIAAYLERPGGARHSLQKKVAKLYDKRSAAAHGKPKHEAEDLLATFNLLRQILMKIIDDGSIPSKEALDAMLFNSAQETDA
ncbi:hypothetical protein LZ683_09255 [Comamonas testosteroni]|uniref:HEPN domain-containing protein n=1 Tax=Comamonas testosteroni TaxID=285 RepID=UPI0023AAC1CE|nr:HEPN domain-containing protein [Comamonas testosteroni]WEE79520.1 hypothetical protein LZ683_09255 [Comamonas testosteroni]